MEKQLNEISRIVSVLNVLEHYTEECADINKSVIADVLQQSQVVLKNTIKQLEKLK